MLNVKIYKEDIEEAYEVLSNLISSHIKEGRFSGAQRCVRCYYYISEVLSNKSYFTALEEFKDFIEDGHLFFEKEIPVNRILRNLKTYFILREEYEISLDVVDYR